MKDNCLQGQSMASDGMPGYLTAGELEAANRLAKTDDDVLSVDIYNRCGFLTHTPTYQRLILPAFGVAAGGK